MVISAIWNTPRHSNRADPVLNYINDITAGIDSKMRLFADDSIIYREIHDHQDHISPQKDITKLQIS